MHRAWLLASLFALPGCLEEPGDAGTPQAESAADASGACYERGLFLSDGGWISDVENVVAAGHVIPVNAFGYGAEVGAIRANGNLVLPVDASLPGDWSTLQATLYFEVSHASATLLPVLTGYYLVDETLLSVPMPGVMTANDRIGGRSTTDRNGSAEQREFFTDGDLRLHGLSHFSSGVEGVFSISVVSDPDEPDGFGDDIGRISRVTASYCP